MNFREKKTPQLIKKKKNTGNKVKVKNYVSWPQGNVSEWEVVLLLETYHMECSDLLEMV